MRVRRLGAAALAAAVTVAISSVAGAQERVHALEPNRRWYGWQIVPFDAAAAGLIAGGISRGDGQGAVLNSGLGVYVASGPAVHFANARPGTALGSLGLRVGSPFVLGYAGMAVLGASDEDDSLSAPLAGFALGFGIGMLAAAVVDSAFLASKPAPPEPGSSACLKVRPDFLISKQGVLLAASASL